MQSKNKCETPSTWWHNKEPIGASQKLSNLVFLGCSFQNGGFRGGCYDRFVKVHEDIDKLLSEKVQKYPVLYNKTLKTTK